MAAIVADVDDAIDCGWRVMQLACGDVAPKEVAADSVEGKEAAGIAGAVHNAVENGQGSGFRVVGLEVGERIAAGRVQGVHFASRPEIDRAAANHRGIVPPAHGAAPEVFSTEGFEGVEAVFRGGEVDCSPIYYRPAVHRAEGGEAPQLLSC